MSNRPIPLSPIIVGLIVLGGLIYIDVRFLEGQIARVAAIPTLFIATAVIVGLLVTRTFSSRGRSTGAHGLDVTSFRLVTAQGDNYDCRVLGNIDNGAVRAGDSVELLGMISWDRTVHVSNIQNHKTGARVRPLPPIRYRLVQISQFLIAFAVVALIVAIFASLLIERLT